MDRCKDVVLVAGILLAAVLLTYGNLIVEVIFRAIGI